MLRLTLVGALAAGCGNEEPTAPIQNTPPTASFTVAPDSGSIATAFWVDASGSLDLEDSPAGLRVRWDWESDGAWDSDWATRRTAAHQYGTTGMNTIKLQVMDTGELTATATRAVLVAATNTPPAASFAVMPESGTTQTVFRCDASHCQDREDSLSALQVRWDWESDGTWDTAFLGTKIADHQYAMPGTKTIRLEVQDTGGLRATTTRQVKLPRPMVLVPAGTFTMGDGEAYCGVDQRLVTLTRGFYLGQFEVTNEEYRDALQCAYEHGWVTVTPFAVSDNLDGSTRMLVDLSRSYCEVFFSHDMFGVHPGKEDHPMVAVSWYGAAAYCDWLSLRHGLARAYSHSTWECNSGDPYGAEGYRLPTDAEWEYAAQHNDERIYPWGNESPDCSRSNFYYLHGSGSCVGSTSPVGSYPAAATALALYDMAGNVWEWCNDWHTASLGTSPEFDPVGPMTGLARVLRGGSWGSYMEYDLRCASRDWLHSPAGCYTFGGFRYARTQ